MEDGQPSKRRRRPVPETASAAGEAGPAPEVQELLDGAASAVAFNVCDTWKPFLYGQAKKPYFRRLLEFVKQERERCVRFGATVPPPAHDAGGPCARSRSQERGVSAPGARAHRVQVLREGQGEGGHPGPGPVPPAEPGAPLPAPLPGDGRARLVTRRGAGQAHGLSFSVLPGVKIPPSLRNMYKEAAADVGMAVPKHGYLLSWAKQVRARRGDR